MKLSYEKVLTLLYRLKTADLGIQPELRTISTLSQAIGNPHLAFPTIHIAGSNGKGSVATKVAQVLSCSSKKVGLYTSPHLFSFCERIQVDNKLIPEEIVTMKLNDFFSLAKRLNVIATFFDFTTLLAFDYFREEKVDIAVIETGLGGRFDATNIIHPLISIITSISKEHCDTLGSTYDAIAFEKAGIIKDQIPVVIGPKAKYESIYEKAKKCQSPLFEVNEQYPFYDQENSAIARKALDLLSLQFPISFEALEKGLQKRPSCRFETVKDRIILDVAHNSDGFLRLFEALENFYPLEKKRVFLGISKNKDFHTCMAIASKYASHIHLVQNLSSQEDGNEEEWLVQPIWKDCDFKIDNYTIHPFLKEGLKKAYQLSLMYSELFIICGSFYIMKSIKQNLNKML